MSTKTPLRPKQLDAIKLLATGIPAYQVAERLEITVMTLYRWKKIPAFEQKLTAISYSGLKEIAKKMNATTVTAIEILQEVMCDMRNSKEIQVKVALGVLNAMPKVNNALEMASLYKTADFDMQKRFDNQGYSFDVDGNPIPKFNKKDSLVNFIEI